MTHLLFLAQRILDNKALEGQGDFLYETMKRGYPKNFKCAKKIAAAIQKKYGVAVREEELTFLTVHIARVSAVTTAICKFLARNLRRCAMPSINAPSKAIVLL